MQLSRYSWSVPAREKADATGVPRAAGAAGAAAVWATKMQRAMGKIMNGQELDGQDADMLISLLFVVGACVQALACWNAEFSLEQGEGKSTSSARRLYIRVSC